MHALLYQRKVHLHLPIEDEVEMSILNNTRNYLIQELIKCQMESDANAAHYEQGHYDHLSSSQGHWSSQETRLGERTSTKSSSDKQKESSRSGINAMSPHTEQDDNLGDGLQTGKDGFLHITSL